MSNVDPLLKFKIGTYWKIVDQYAKDMCIAGNLGKIVRRSFGGIAWRTINCSCRICEIDLEIWEENEVNFVGPLDQVLMEILYE